jgi:hypothetical protein
LSNSIDNSQEFLDGLHRMQRLLDIPTKEGDMTSVLQATSKVIYDKLRADIIQANLAQNKSHNNVTEHNLYSY